MWKSYSFTKKLHSLKKYLSDQLTEPYNGGSSRWTRSTTTDNSRSTTINHHSSIFWIVWDLIIRRCAPSYHQLQLNCKLNVSQSDVHLSLVEQFYSNAKKNNTNYQVAWLSISVFDAFIILKLFYIAVECCSVIQLLSDALSDKFLFKKMMIFIFNKKMITFLEYTWSSSCLLSTTEYYWINMQKCTWVFFNFNFYGLIHWWILSKWEHFKYYFCWMFLSVLKFEFFRTFFFKFKKKGKDHQLYQ